MDHSPAAPPPARSRLPGYARPLLTVGFGLIMAFVLIEGAGRLVLGFAPLPGWAQDFNNRVGYQLRPDEEYIYVSQSGEFENPVRHNSRGLHDVEHALNKPDGVFRILILADSYGHAREVPLAANFARRLEVLLNQSAPPGTTFEVINAGHFGLGTTQEYLTYRVEGRRYQPDLVLLGFYVGNDVLDNHAPLIEAWNGTDHVDFPYYSPEGTLYQPGMAARRRVLSWLRQNSYTANVIAGALAGTGQPDRVEVGDPNTETGRVLRVPAGVYLLPDATWLDAWAVTNHVLTELKAVVESDGAQFAVFVIPDRREIYDDDWQATLAKLPDLNPADLERTRPVNTIMSLLESQRIPALDLSGPFRAAGERLYFPVDGHFNPAGHAVTAQALADWLRGAELIPQDSGS